MEGSEAGGRQTCLQVAPWLADTGEREHHGVGPSASVPASTWSNACFLHAFVHPPLLHVTSSAHLMLSTSCHSDLMRPLILFYISIFPQHLLCNKIYKLLTFYVCSCVFLPHSLTLPHSSRARILVFFTRVSQVHRTKPYT